MNILIICESIDIINGGSIAQTKRIIQGLKTDNNIVLLTTRISDNSSLDLNGIKVYEFSTGPALGINNFRYITNISAAKIAAVLTDERIDLIYNVHPTPVSKKIRAVSKPRHIPFVNHVHVPLNQNFHMLPKIIRYKFIGDLIDAYIVHCYKNSDLLILTGTYDKKLEQEIHEANIPCAIVSNGIDTEKFKKIMNKDVLLAKYDLSKSMKILYVGRYSPEKNLEVLLHACNEIADIDYELLVVGHDEIRKNFEDRFTNKNIIYMGPRTRDELIEIYSLADVLVLPSLIELESLVFLEAVSCSLPIIISDSTENKTNQHMNNNGYLFKSNMPKDLAEEIRSVLKDHELRKKMGDQSRKIALDLDFAKSIHKINQLFADVVQRHANTEHGI